MLTLSVSITNQWEMFMGDNHLKQELSLSLSFIQVAK